MKKILVFFSILFLFQSSLSALAMSLEVAPFCNNALELSAEDMLGLTLQPGDIVSADRTTIYRTQKNSVTQRGTGKLDVILDASTHPKSVEIDLKLDNEKSVDITSLRVSKDQKQMFGLAGSSIVVWDLKTGERKIFGFSAAVKAEGAIEIARAKKEADPDWNRDGNAASWFMDLGRQDATVTRTDYLDNGKIYVEGYMHAPEVSNWAMWLGFKVVLDPSQTTTPEQNVETLGQALQSLSVVPLSNSDEGDRPRAIRYMKQLGSHTSENWVASSDISVSYGYNGNSSRGYSQKSNLIEVTRENRRDIIKGQTVEIAKNPPSDYRIARVLVNGKIIILKEISQTGEGVGVEDFSFSDWNDMGFEVSPDSKLVAAITYKLNTADVYVWDAGTGMPVLKFNIEHLINRKISGASDFRVISQRFDPSSKAIVISVIFQSSGETKEAQFEVALTNLKKIRSAYVKFESSENDAKDSIDYLESLIKVKGIHDANGFQLLQPVSRQ